MQYRIEHESMPLWEEKQLLREMKVMKLNGINYVQLQDLILSFKRHLITLIKFKNIVR